MAKQTTTKPAESGVIEPLADVGKSQRRVRTRRKRAGTPADIPQAAQDAPVKKSKSKKEVLKAKPIAKPEAIKEAKPEAIKEAKPAEAIKDGAALSARDKLANEFEGLIQLIHTEIQQTADNKTRVVHMKTWRNLLKEVKKVKAKSLKNVKKNVKRKPNVLSGFMKPVQVSKELTEFAGWNENELKSRVDVTTFLCKYIKENNLEKPDDRRHIVADDKLKKLLKYDENKDTPLTYCYLQKKIQPLFTKA